MAVKVPYRDRKAHVNRLSVAALLTTVALPVCAMLAFDAGANAAEQDQILLQADQITYDTEKQTVVAAGHVEFSKDGRVLTADKVSYDQNSGNISADGHVQFTDEFGNVAFADHVDLSDDFRDGMLKSFSALMGDNGRLAANAAARREGRYIDASHAVFSPCRICAENGDRTPLWEVKAGRVVHDAQEKTITYEDATFEFLDTPVFYLPYFSTPDPTVKRKSGFLIPTFGSSTQLGSYAEIPYYYSVSPTQDFTVSPLFTTGGANVLKGEYRERFDDGGGFWLQGSAGYDPHATGFLDSKSWNSHLFGSGRVPLTDSWRLGFDAQLVSNDTYLRRYDISNADRLTSDLFVDRTWNRSRLALTSYYFQSLRDGVSQGTMPLVMPLAEMTYVPESKIWGGRLSVQGSAIAIRRDLGADTTRGSVSADWRAPYVTENGQIFTFEMFGRGDVYHITDALLANPAATSNNETVSRGLGAAMLEWRWPFVKKGSVGNVTYVVEPIAQAIFEPYGGNPTDIINEDSQTFEFDENNLFSIDKFPGLDRWSSGPQANAGVRVTATLPTGIIEGVIGQNYRLKRDNAFPIGSSLGDTRSDVVGRFTVSFPPYFDLTHRFEIEENSGTLRRNEVYLRGQYGRSTVDLNYLKLAADTLDPTLGPREEVTLRGTVNIYGNWSLFANMQRDMKQSKMIEEGAGLSYEDECFVASLGWRRQFTSDRDLRPGSAVILRVGLKSGFSTPTL